MSLFPAKPYQNQTQAPNLFPALVVLFVAMAILKVTDTIDWSWWIVTLPLYLWAVVLGLALVLWIFGTLLMGLAALLEKAETKLKKEKK